MDGTLVLRGKRMGDRPISRFPAVLGSAEGSAVRIRGSQILPRHATIARRAGRYFIRDEGGAAGTLVNGEPLDGERWLTDGDTINIAGVELGVLLPGGAGAAGEIDEEAPTPATALRPPQRRAGAGRRRTPGSARTAGVAVAEGAAAERRPGRTATGRASRRRLRQGEDDEDDGDDGEAAPRRKGPKRPVAALLMKIGSVIVILACIGTIGWLIYNFKRKPPKVTTTTVPSESRKFLDLFREEKVAGNKCFRGEQWKEAVDHYEKSLRAWSDFTDELKKQGKDLSRYAGYEREAERVIPLLKEAREKAYIEDARKARENE